MPADIHERRAERGTHRGAANVWANAQPHADPAPAPKPTSRWIFRLVIAAGLCAGLVAVALASTRESEVDAVDGDVARSQDSVEAPQDDDLPLPILIDGVDLEDAIGPCVAEDGLVCEVDRQVSTNVVGLDPELGTETPTIVVFGEDDSPFAGPILGVENFDGGFRTWTLNVDQDEAAELVAQVMRVGDSWQLPESTGLVEVQRFEDSTDPLNTWQFDFANDVATLQALRAADGETANEWEWIVPLVRLRDFGPTVDFAMLTLEPVDVLGREAVQLNVPILSNTGEVDGTRVASTIWVEEGYAYRLSGPPTGDASLASQLVLVEREEWERAVLDAYFDEEADLIALLGVLGVIVAAGATLLWLVLRRRSASPRQT